MVPVSAASASAPGPAVFGAALSRHPSVMGLADLFDEEGPLLTHDAPATGDAWTETDAFTDFTDGAEPPGDRDSVRPGLSALERAPAPHALPPIPALADVVDMEAYLHALVGLNSAQAAAVHSDAPRMRVLAGAGSGKTRVLTTRVARLVAQGVPPSQIVLTTFTRKASGEMRQRLHELLATEPANAVTIGTFHALGVRIVRTHAGALGLPSTCTVADERATDGRLGRALVSLGSRAGLQAIRVAAATIDTERQRRVQAAWDAVQAGTPLTSPDAPLAHFLGTDLPEDSLYRRYHALCTAEQAIDFDALGYLPVLLLLARPDLRDAYRAAWPHLLVDEFQDTSTVQMQLLQLLTGPDSTVCIVGDDAQAIYGFRGADLTNLQTFEQIFPGTVTFRLEQNYRSQARIVEAANVISAHTGTLPKTLFTTVPGEAPIVVVEAATPEHEAADIAARLQAYHRAGTLRAWSDAMVLYRSNAQADGIEAACRRLRIPVRLARGVRFFCRVEPMILLAPLTLCRNPADGEALSRLADLVTPRPSARTIERLQEYAVIRQLPVVEVARHHVDAVGLSKPQREAVAGMVAFLDGLRLHQHSPVAMLRWVLQRTQLRNRLIDEIPEFDPTLDDTVTADELLRRIVAAEQRVANIDALLLLAADFEATRRGGVEPHDLAAFLDDIAVLRADDEPGPPGGAVQCMSVHSAKGLEAPVVAVMGCNEGVFPVLQYAPGSREGVMDDEEARLFYVAITRAQQHLLLTCARARPRRLGATYSQSAPASRFLRWLPDWCHVRTRV